LPAEAYHDFPLSENWEWDASEAEPGLRKWASSDGSGDKDKIDFNKLRKCYFWHEAGELSEFGQLKFPYCRIENGEPHVVHNAVQNALARIDNSSIPEEDKPAVRRVAQKQMDRFREEEGTDSRLAKTTDALKKQYGTPTPPQLEKINYLAKRNLSKEEVFVFPTKMVGDALIVERCMQLHKSLLEVYRNDAQKGVAFMLDHPWAGFFSRPKPAYPYGRTFDAVLRKSDGIPEGEKWALYGDVYIVRNKEKDGISTDAIISDIEDGTLFDVSIGFGFQKAICSICGNDYFSNECEHFTGVIYDDKLCYIVGCPPGWLGELSAVWDGAYPTAGILSKESYPSEEQVPFVLLHEMPQEDAKKMRGNAPIYGCYSSARNTMTAFLKKEDIVKGNVFNVPDLSKVRGGVKTVNEKTINLLEALGMPYKEGETNLADVLSTIAEKWGDALQSFALMPEDAEVPFEKWQFYAQEGKKYITDIVNDAIAMGVRALGNNFPADTWKNRLSEMSASEIKDIMATWERMAKEDIPAGRKTQAGAIEPEPKSTNIPEEFFKI